MEKCEKSNPMLTTIIDMMGRHCKNFEETQHRDHAWYLSCVRNQETYYEGMKTMMADYPKEKICHAMGTEYGSPPGNAAEMIAKERGFSCDKLLYDTAKEGIKKFSDAGICKLPYSTKHHPETLRAVQEEIKARSLDCSNVMSMMKTK